MKRQTLAYLISLLLLTLSFQACQKEAIPKTMTINSIEVIRYPPSSTGGWDVASNPDLFATIVQGTGVNASDRVTSTRVDASTPALLSMTSKYTINSFNNLWTIGIYDEDSFDPDDFMGYVSFFPSSYTSELASSFIVAEGQTEILISVDWEF